METILIIAAAVLWGCGTGLLISRPAYRLSVPPEEPWQSACPAGHPFTGTGGGWLGRARCTARDSYGPNVLSVASATAVVCALLAAATGTHPELMVWLLLSPTGGEQTVQALQSGAVVARRRLGGIRSGTSRAR